MPGTRPGMTEQACLDSILYLGKIRDRARGGADFIQQLQTILAYFWIVVVDLDLVEECIDRRTQFRHRAHRTRKIFFCDSSAGFRLHLIDSLRQRLLLIEGIQRGIRRTVIGLAVFLLFDAENIGGALGARQQVLAVVGVEEFAQRLDATDDKKEIVLAFERKHSVDEIVARALLAELDFEAIGKKLLKPRGA